jgi:hypothetical protein
MTDRVWIAERWNKGLWGQAHWNGQLGFNAQLGQVVLRGNVASHLLMATTSAVTVSGIPVICRSGRGLRAQPGAIVVTGFGIGTRLQWHMPATAATTPETGQVAVTGIWANLVPFFGAGELQFGIPVRRKVW